MLSLRNLISCILLRMTKKLLFLLSLLFSLSYLTGCTASSFNTSLQMPFSHSQPAITEASLNDNSNLWQSDNNTIWYKVQHTSLTKVQAALAQSNHTIVAGWLKLGIINKQYSTDKTQFINQLIAWRKENPTHPANSLFPNDATLITLLSAPLPKHIALLLPLQGPFATQGQAIRDGFLNAYYQSAPKQNNQQTISFIDTSKTNNMHDLYNQAISDGADMVIGPLTKENVQALSQQGSFPVPTLALNYTDVWFGALPTNLYQFGLSPEDEAAQVAEKAQQQGHSKAILIAPQDAWGQRVTKTLISQWQSLGGSITDSFFYSSQSNLTQAIPRLLHVDPEQDRTHMQKDNNKTQLEKQRRHDFDVIFLLAPPDIARQIVPLLKYYYANDIPIYSTSIIYSGTPSPQKDIDLNGVAFCDIPWTLSHQSGNRLFAVGRDSYLLTSELPLLIAMPAFPLYAATGALSLTSKHQIYRRLPWAKIHEGHP